MGSCRERILRQRARLAVGGDDHEDISCWHHHLSFEVTAHAIAKNPAKSDRFKPFKVTPSALRGNDLTARFYTFEGSLGARLFRAGVEAAFLPYSGGTKIEILIRQSPRDLGILFLLSLIFSYRNILALIDRVREIITGDLELETFLSMYKYVPFPFVFTFLPVFIPLFGVILAWIYFQLEAWKAQRYLEKDLGLNEMEQSTAIT
jgi:hypothetical protein